MHPNHFTVNIVSPECKVSIDSVKLLAYGPNSSRIILPDTRSGLNVVPTGLLHVIHGNQVSLFHHFGVVLNYSNKVMMITGSCIYKDSLNRSVQANLNTDEWQEFLLLSKSSHTPSEWIKRSDLLGYIS